MTLQQTNLGVGQKLSLHGEYILVMGSARDDVSAPSKMSFRNIHACPGGWAIGSDTGRDSASPKHLPAAMSEPSLRRSTGTCLASSILAGEQCRSVHRRLPGSPRQAVASKNPA